MKFPFPPVFLAAAGLILAAPPASVRAGSAVATDNHGGFGYYHGDYPSERLEQEAVRRCRSQSKYPDDVKVIVTSRRRGAGIIVRYQIDGRPHVYAYVGAEGDQQARKYATDYVEGYGGSKIEVVARWQD